MESHDKLDIGMQTDVGMRRSNNQDSCRSQPATNDSLLESHGHFFIVADGMGGHAVGELASQLAVDTIPHTYHKLEGLSRDHALTKAFRDTNSLIWNKAQANPEFHGMGTTGTSLILTIDGAMFAHVGDSRAYRIRDGKIHQLTFDHSWVWEIAKQSGMSLKDAHSRYPSNRITRSLGPERDVEVDIIGPYKVQPDDVYLLCSDGLSGQVTDAEIGFVSAHLKPDDAAQMLIDLANLRGGPDNITVLIVRIEQGRESSSGTTSEPKPSRIPALSLMGMGVLGLIGAGAAVMSTKPIIAGALLLIGALMITGGVAMVRVSGRHGGASSTELIHAEQSTALSLGMRDTLQVELARLKARAQDEGWTIDFDNCDQTIEYLKRATIDEESQVADLLGKTFRQFGASLRKGKEDTDRMLSE